MVRAFAHGAMGRRIDPSWWTHWAISRSSQHLPTQTTTIILTTITTTTTIIIIIITTITTIIITIIIKSTTVH